jgi:hypothetical protein
MALLVLTIVLLLGTSDVVFGQSTIYADSATRLLVQKARDRRQNADVSIESYKALSRERMSVGLRGLRRDRLMYRREVAGRVEWTREGPGRIEVLGAREMIPVAMKGVKLPDDLVSFMPHLAFDPADNRMLFGWDDDSFVRHPLADDAEAHYRFRTGGTTTIQLQDGRIVRLLELEIIPQRSDPRLISGSFWLDAETHAVVQAAFRLARKIDILRDLEDDEDDPDDDKIPGFLRNITADLDYVTIDYGLYDLRWWMPRLVAFEGVVRVGPMRMPLLYERSYSQYEIEGLPAGVTIPMAELVRRDSVREQQREQCRGGMQINVSVGGGERSDSARQLSGKCGRWEIVMAADTSRIMASELLPADPFSDDEELLTEADLRQLKDKLENLGDRPTLLGQPELHYSLIDPGMVRYNRIESLSVGSSVAVDFGAYNVSANARIGLADWEPNFELQVEKPGQSMSLAVAGYRRLNGTEPLRDPFSLGGSLASLLFGRDDADFYRSLGVELRGAAAGSTTGRYWWRLYAQRERSAEVETDFSVRHLFDKSHTFEPNIVADRNNAVGMEGVLRFHHGLNPTGFRFGAELYGNGATGTFDYARAALTLRLAIPLPGPLDMATEYAAGTSVDSLPVQHRWYIGGATTLRGYYAGTMTGESFWRGRAEIGYGLPAIRLIGFGDVGWAGPRDSFSKGRPLLSAGAGISVMDGILRFDVARALREPKGWLATLYFDAAL